MTFSLSLQRVALLVAASAIVALALVASFPQSAAAQYGYGCWEAGQWFEDCPVPPPPPPPYAALTVSPSSVTQGQSVLITWYSGERTSCTGTNFNTGGATSGSVSVTPSASTSYTVTCYGSSYPTQSSDSKYVTVTIPLSASLQATPSSITAGGSSTLNWSSTAANSCIGTGFSTGNAPSGSTSVSPTVTTQYEVQCSQVSSYPVSCDVGPAQHLDTGVYAMSYPDGFVYVDDCAPWEASTPACGSMTTGQNYPMSRFNSYGQCSTGVTLLGGGYCGMNGRTCDTYYWGSSSGPTVTATKTVTVNGSLLSGACSVSPSSVNPGESATWSAAPTGGTGSYTYSWSGTDGLSGTTQAVQKSYGSNGTKTASVTVTSGSEQIVLQCSNALTVGAQCSDGIDNNGSGGADYPADPSCTGPGDTTENGVVQVSCTVDSSAVAVGGTTTYRAAGGNGVFAWTPSAQTLCSGGANNRCTFPIAGDYTMSVTSAGSSQSCPVVSTGCAGTPEVTITANGASGNVRVEEGKNATIEWTMENVEASSCTVTSTQGYSTNVAPNACNLTEGSVTHPIETQTTYTITCAGADPAFVIVNVGAGLIEF